MSQQHRVGKTATSVFTDKSGALCCVYHQTCVAKKHKNGVIELNSNGWRTATTKTRMNQFSNQHGLGYTVSQKDGLWSVSVGGKVIPFHDHMTIRT